MKVNSKKAMLHKKTHLTPAGNKHHTRLGQICLSTTSQTFMFS